MGPAINIAKHMLEKAKNFTMQGVDLIYQFNSRSPDYHAKKSYRPKPFKTSKGLVKGINLKYDNNEIKNRFSANEYGITHVERMYTEPKL